VRVLSNSTYDQSLSFLARFQGFGGILPISHSSNLLQGSYSPWDNSLPRFVCAADMVQKFRHQKTKPAVDYAFDVLTSVTQPANSYGPTQWSIVYDIQHRRIYFRTKTNDKIRQINFTSFDFSCTTPVKVLDVNADLSGDVTNKFIDYTDAMNRKLFKTMVPNVTDEELDAYERYIKSLVCTE